jgi:Cytochrome oxidase complex assembly protein 1
MTNRTVGCIGLGSCLSSIAILVLVVGIIAGVFYMIAGTFKSSPVYRDAMQAAQSNSRVIQSLGTPIQSGWLVTGSIEEQGLSGDATLVIPISGPRGSGTLYASAREGNGKWQFYTLAVQVDGQDQVIELR